MFDYIEDEEIRGTILKLQHTVFTTVYRALHSKIITKEDFIPSIIEKRNRQKKKAALGTENLSSYSVSLFLSIDAIKCIFQTSPVFANTHQGIARGFTTERRGISILTNKDKQHIDYFLYDYKANSPAEDFEVVQ